MKDLSIFEHLNAFVISSKWTFINIMDTANLWS